MKLILEAVEDVKTITEEVDGKKRVYLEGTYLQGAIPNRNGRRYPEEILDTEVNRYIKEKVEKNCAYGEVGHPDGPTVNLDRVGIHVKSLRKEGTNWVGKALVASTPMGNIIKGLLEDGSNLGVSSRGLGTLKKASDGIMEVQSDFRLAAAADVVADPSAPDAYVQGIMEGREYWYDAATGMWKEEQVGILTDEMKRMSARKLQEQKVELFARYLNIIAKN